MILDIKNIIINKHQVMKFLGYGSKKEPPIIAKKVDEEIEKAKEVFEPQVFLKQFEIDGIKDDEISFGSLYKIKSSYVAEQLKEASFVYVSIYTIGDKIENKIKEYSNSSEMIRAMILDKIGVVALDNINYQIKEEISKHISTFKISSQLYPSQKDFDILNQSTILDVFKKENNTITISKHYQFNPIKTVAVLFGIGKDEEKYNMCDICENKCY